MNITIPKTGLDLPPNLYDEMSTCNGCGNYFSAEILGIDADLIFGSACRRHDFRYSPYSPCTRSEADRLFIEEMNEIIRDGDYNPVREELYEFVAELYHDLVRAFGHFSYSKFQPELIQPSLILSKVVSMKDIECVNIKVLISDDTYVHRWYTRGEAEVLGLI